MISWKQLHFSCGVVVVATVAWLLFEQAGLPVLSICSDVLLILVVLRFLRANYAVIQNQELQERPELVLSEEMVNSAAAFFRGKVNSVLLFAYDISLGKNLKLFFKVMVCLWGFSVICGLFSFFTLAYVGTMISVTVSALYSRNEEHMDRFAGFVDWRFSRHYKIMDEDVVTRPPQSMSNDKDD